MKTERHILLAGSDAGLLPAAKAAVRQLGLALETAPKGPLATQAARAYEAVAVLAVVTLSRAGAIEDFQRLARSLPDRKVVAAAQNASGEDVRRLFRAGAADVLTAPFTTEAILASLGEVIRQQIGSVAAEHGRIVSVIKTGGGAGATTVALNFAALLAQGDERRRRPPLSTAVLDLDVQFGDTDVALDLTPRSTLIDVLRAPGRVDARFLQSVMTDHTSGLKLLAPSPALAPVDALTPESALGLLEHSAANFERTFVDLPSTWSDWTFQVLARSDVIALVSPPTVAGAVGARRVLQALAEAKVDRPVFFILNKLNGVIDAFEKPSRIGRTLDLGVDAALAFDPQAVKAADRGKLIGEAFPSSRFAKDLKNAAAKLESRIEAVEDGVALTEVAA